MPHGPHSHAEIAAQAGVSIATVDRVLNARPGASARATRAVEQAVLDLDRQQTRARLGASTLVLDLVMQAPARFSHAVRDALESAARSARPATVRSRAHLRESATPAEVAATLDDIGRRRPSDGVLLKAPDDPTVAAAVDRLAARGIPVITLVTEVTGCRRLAYVGLDNVAAGATAAALVELATRDDPGCLVATLSRTAFQGERERLDAFRRALPHREIVVLSDADGLDASTTALIRELLVVRRDVVGLYSIGGGNRGIATELDAAGVRPRIHLGHDLDADNVALLRAGRLTAVLHHDLRADARWALTQFLHAHGILPGAASSRLAAPQIVTPHNLPPRLR